VLGGYERELGEVVQELGYNIQPIRVVRDWGKHDSLYLSDPDGNRSTSLTLVTYKENPSRRVAEDATGIREQVIVTLRKWIRHVERAEKEKPVATGKPGPKPPPIEQVAEWQTLELAWLTYSALCEAEGKRPMQNEQWQRWRCEHGESDKDITLDTAKQMRKDFRQHVKRNPSDKVSLGN